MASTERKNTKKLGKAESHVIGGESKTLHTYRTLTEERVCQKTPWKKYCTPWVDTKLHFHFAPNLAEKIIAGGSGTAGAVATGIAIAGHVSTAGISALVSFITMIALEFARNEDGSLDVYVYNWGYKIDGKRFHDGSAATVLRVLAP